jgi:hypothetical protein
MILNMVSTLSRFKVNVSTKIKNKITNIKSGAQKFKENFSEAKNKPRSKRKSLLLGFTTVLGIFGVTLLASVSPAVAKDLPKDTPKAAPVSPSPTPQPKLLPSEKIIGNLSSAAATICGLAVTSSSYMIGAVCGVIVVVGILKAQGK